jgi:hypothetical protein
MTNPNTPRAATVAASTAIAEKPIWARVEELSQKLALLEAMLGHTCGGSYESFDDLDDDQRDAYLSQCFLIASAARVEAINTMEAAMKAARTTAATV